VRGSIFVGLLMCFENLLPLESTSV